MLFKDIEVGQDFYRKGSTELVWTKNKPFTAYGDIKDQNAAACFNHPLITRWHYDHVHDDEEVVLCNTQQQSK